MFIPAITANNATNAQTAVSATSADTAQLQQMQLTASIALGISTKATINNPTETSLLERFIGDGSRCKNVVASGSGVIVKDLVLQSEQQAQLI